MIPIREYIVTYNGVGQLIRAASKATACRLFAIVERVDPLVVTAKPYETGRKNK